MVCAIMKEVGESVDVENGKYMGEVRGMLKQIIILHLYTLYYYL